MSRLRKVTGSGPGITRIRRGRGFSYEDQRGRKVRDAETLSRIRSLAIPPAWTEVWISPHENGHIQATGTDDAGRRQYLYHQSWRDRQDIAKFRRVESFARTLPDVRRAVERDLKLPGMQRERALACAIRLLDQAFFRIGSEDHMQRNGSFGLATIRKSHVTLARGRATFDYEAKSGKRQIQVVHDPALMPTLRAMKERRGGGHELLAYKADGRWRDLRSGEINTHLKDLAGDEFSAKDFRTWHATVLAAVEIALAELDTTSITSRRRVASATVKTVAEHLGNTPAVCRASYIDPRIFDRFNGGITIGASLAEMDSADDRRVRERIERAVLDLLAGDGERTRAA